ncbi:MAG: DNA adenine methylase [Opitutales bacterium]|nr:DNA adenine methylase [Opitutales bacterium]
MKAFTEDQMLLIPSAADLPAMVHNYPRFRYMGSKFRLLPWIHETLAGIEFETVTDAFSGSGVVSYLFKTMGKKVHSNDSLAFPSVLSHATVANNDTRISDTDLKCLLSAKAKSDTERFIRRTFEGIFYTPAELSFLDDL